MTKTTYDGLGRQRELFVTDRRDDPAPGSADGFGAVHDDDLHAAEVDDDVVVEQTTFGYDAETGLPQLTTWRRRTHDAAESEEGALSGLSNQSVSVPRTPSSAAGLDAGDFAACGHPLPTGGPSSPASRPPG